MSGHDPIERMREAFESIEPVDGAMRRWEQALSAISRQPSMEDTGLQAPGAGHSAPTTQSPVPSPHRSASLEPMPWRLLIGSASVAAASIALLAVGVFDPPARSPSLAAAPVEVSRVAMMAAAPVMETPAPDGTKWHLHWPSLGVDLKGSLDMLTSAFFAPFRPGA